MSDVFVAIFEPPHPGKDGKLDELEGSLKPWDCFNELVGPFKDDQAAMEWIDWFKKPSGVEPIPDNWFHFSIVPASTPESIFKAVES